MRKISLILFLFVNVVINAQVITIYDVETNEVVTQATLRDSKSTKFAITNNRGATDISLFKEVNEIEIRGVGYETTVISYKKLSESPSFYLVPSNTSLDDLIVPGTRVKQFTTEVPNKIITITSKDVALQNPQTAADLLAISGKVFMQKSQQGGGSPMIRGFATNRLLYTVDGVRMNTAIFRGGNIQNVISLDPFAIEQTEVVFGPSSVLYGSDAIGGIMGFQTLTPAFSLTDETSVTGKALARYSSANNEKTGHFDVNIGWEKWALVTSFSSFNFGDLKMGSYGPEEYLRPFYVKRIDSIDVVVTNENTKVQAPSGYTQINLMQKVRFQPTANWDFQYGFHYSETSNYDRYDRHVRYKNGLPRYGEWYYGPQKWMMNNLAITHDKANLVYDQMVIRLAQQNFEESRVSRDFNKDDREIRVEEVDAYSLNADFVKSLNVKNKLLYGAEYVINEVTSTGINQNIATGVSQAGPSRYPQSDWSSIGVYISDQQKINAKTLLEASVRYNQFNLSSTFDTTFYPFPFTEANISNNAITGNLGTVIRPTNEWMISANLATAFRSPNVDDVGKVFDSEPGAVTVPNPDLSAEYAYNADLNIAKSFGKLAKIEVSGFYTILQNALVRRDFTLNGMDSILYDGTLSQVQAIQNAANTTVYGLQAGVTLNFSKEFSFSTDVNYQVGEEELDDGTVSPSRHAAPFFGVSRLAFTSKNLSLQLYTNYSAEVSYENMPEGEKSKDYIYAIDENGNPFSPSWATLNFKAMYRVSETFSVSGGLENITDVRYRPYSSGLVAAGRNFMLSARCSF